MGRWPRRADASPLQVNGPYLAIVSRGGVPEAGPPPNLAIGLIRALRPRQWVKNVLVVAAPLATLGGGSHYNYRDVFFEAGVAFVVFCMAASSTYLINDARDVHADRQHPTKRFRPIAAGVVSPSLAYLLALGLAVAAVAISASVSMALALVTAIYLALQLGYNFGLKHIAVIDICIVSGGFLIRAVGGGVAAGVPLSQWFLLVMAFFSLFMAAGKRYAELQLAERTGAKIRRALENYTGTYLRFVWTMSATATVVFYGLWAFDRDHNSVSWFAASMIPITIAVLRYAVDVDGGLAGEPEEIVLHDRVIQLMGGCWIAIMCAAINLE